MKPAGVGFFAPWGLPIEPLGQLSLVAAVVFALLAIAAARRGVESPRRLSHRAFRILAAGTAFALSCAYVHVYLRGGPRIIDATTYYLQARALAEGHLTWAVPEPSASFRGRFLFTHPVTGAVAGVFPIGYPILLAAGFLARAPMLVGPVLAAAIAWATYGLARAVAERDPDLRPHALAVARAAALFSVVSACLRYHTADTMSHGLAALLVAALARVLVDATSPRAWVFAGLCAGALGATRLASGMGAVLVALPLTLCAAQRLRAVRSFVVGLVPGLALLALSQWAATGSPLRTTQSMYYALSDGPPDCFRYGFGQGVGCLFEHGDVVATRLGHGYGALEALSTSAHRLLFHLGDVLNFEPLFLLCILGFRLRASRGSTILGGYVAIHLLAYAPFYFDGNYPGGGARLYADVLPLEHVLAARGLALVAGSLSLDTRLYAIMATACAAFGLHRASDHVSLRDREGGHPMYDAAFVAAKVPPHSVVFVDTDHGFALGHDPDALARGRPLVARLRGDDRDRMLVERTGLPGFHYAYDFASGSAFVSRYEPAHTGPTESSWRFQAELEWPVLSQIGGYALPAFAIGTCAEGTRVLTVTPTSAEAAVRIALPVPKPGIYTLRVGVFTQATGGHGRVELRDRSVEWLDQEPGREPSACKELEFGEVGLDASASVLLIASGAPVSIDAFTLTPVVR
jgi:hypothetical protein